MNDVDEVVAEFLVESHENLDRLDQDLLELEANPTERSIIARVFRTIHTIKGTCGFLGFNKLEAVAHVGESLLSRLRDGALVLDAEITSALLAMVDAVREMLGAIEATGSDGDKTYPAVIALLQALQNGGPRPTVTPAAPPVTAEAPAPTKASAPAPKAKKATTKKAAAKPATKAVAAASTTKPARPDLVDPDSGKPMGELLVDMGVVGPEDVELALVEQQFGDGRPIGQILVEHGVATPAAVEEAVRLQGDDHSGDHRVRTESTIRVDVNVLDRLMTLVGELVLARNNIVQHLGGRREPAILAASQRLDLVTSELQESVMKTRMQPIGNVWAKFPRVVRDLAHTLSKQVKIETEGEETELDRTIIEAIKDPLTHVVRNSVDHGIESPEVRLAAGKPAEGTLRLRALHEGGLVVIEIADDGAGVDVERVKAKALSNGIITIDQAASLSVREATQLIFMPGFSTADKVTNVSGRGVGMDVVKTNIEKIGGTVDVQSELGKGTTLRVKIPLTLAIVPALVVRCAEGRYAIPQVDVVELVRLDGERVQTGVEWLHNAPVYRLRGNLLPLVDLRDELGRGSSLQEASITIVVVSADDRQFGLVVDGVDTTEEIVVKPLDRLLQSVPAFSGATIMGDGRVALILDVIGIAQTSKVVAATRGAAKAERATEATSSISDRTALLLVDHGGAERVAVQLVDVARLEKIPYSSIERADGRDVVQYRGELLPLVTLGELIGGSTQPSEEHIDVVVQTWMNRNVGVVVDRIVDTVEAVLETSVKSEVVLDGRVTRLVDLAGALDRALHWMAPELVEAGR